MDTSKKHYSDVYLSDEKECEELIGKYCNEIYNGKIKGLVKYNITNFKLNGMYSHTVLLEILNILKEHHMLTLTELQKRWMEYIDQIRETIRSLPIIKTLSQKRLLKTLKKREKTYMYLIASIEDEKEKTHLASLITMRGVDNETTKTNVVRLITHNQQSNQSNNKFSQTENNANQEKESSQKNEKSWYEKIMEFLDKASNVCIKFIKIIFEVRKTWEDCNTYANKAYMF